MSLNACGEQGSRPRHGEGVSAEQIRWRGSLRGNSAPQVLVQRFAGTETTRCFNKHGEYERICYEEDPARVASRRS